MTRTSGPRPSSCQSASRKTRAAKRLSDWHLKQKNMLNISSRLCITGMVQVVVSQQDLCITFIIDEDRYYVYLYSNPEKARIKSFKNQVEQENLLSKFGKEHLPTIMQMIFCHGFETKHGFSGMFLDTNPPGKEFLLAPYIWNGSSPRAFVGAEPILMKTYKSKIPFEPTQRRL